MLRFRSRSYFLTYPQCDIILESLLDACKQKFIHIGGEVADYIVADEDHEDGSKHRHCYFKLKQSLNKKVPANILDIEGHHPHIDFVKSDRKCRKYCKKGGRFITNLKFDDEKVTKRDIGDMLVNQGKKLVDLVPIYPQLVIGFTRLLSDVESYLAARRPVADLAETCGVWIWGPAGIGKSWWCAKKYPDAYNKAEGKWWDGYTGQEVVVFDDWDAGIKDPRILKYGADFKRFNVERKGISGIEIRPRLFIVTANVSIESYLGAIKWPEWDWEPYLRRFKQYECRSREDVEGLTLPQP